MQINQKSLLLSVKHCFEPEGQIFTVREPRINYSTHMLCAFGTITEYDYSSSKLVFKDKDVVRAYFPRDVFPMDFRCSPCLPITLFELALSKFNNDHKDLRALGLEILNYAEATDISDEMSYDEEDCLRLFLHYYYNLENIQPLNGETDNVGV